MADKSIRDIAWVAGVLEGDGSFVLGNQNGKNGKTYKQHTINLAMSDLDVIEKFTTITGAHSRISRKLPSGKIMYQAAVYGPRAIGWAQTLYPLMGKRRQAKIREIIAAWKLMPGRGRKVAVVPSRTM